MEENKIKITGRNLLPELLSTVLTACCIWGISRVRGKAPDQVLGSVVLGTFGVAVLGFCLRQAYLNQELEYDNREHYLRFWSCFLIGLLAACICAFLPVGGWPYLPLFVMLSLFGNMSIGILAGSVLLMITVMLCGASVQVFLLYFLNGLFAVSLFRHLEDEFKIGARLACSLFSLLLCETAGIILPANEQLSLESFVIPALNLMISGILLAGILKFFYSAVVYKYRVKYLEMNDTENPLLVEYKNTSREDYMQSIHTAYFCERIAGKLGLDKEALKCAGYYHKLCRENKQWISEEKFPPGACGILAEYLDRKNPPRSREAAVLTCAETVINTVQKLLEKSGGRNLDYDYIIENVFDHLMKNQTFSQCSITLQEIGKMREIFKEEKLYYDFLR